ncbi:sulfonate transport system substrate-binding protein [Paenibacillus sophorae]|uniref:Aliphatic sulfonate ABC transporter substrate-binding protein n=1 Tax=Paenibacillus sophorae TaxID=1333845 RepID=A0A1H8M9Y5_9BACL|nr:aliphatic sulfonate ABC transporter substrate-binding protein [Paenibacillus sophorae]QWU17730.1 aliphatic sulfonate ABC transporter substrate-binding protein [Paenibacillus sophorae]SEO14155.1 sulfonate transport system substrate-binding protein [Paenibacillus sophorae]
MNKIQYAKSQFFIVMLVIVALMAALTGCSSNTASSENNGTAGSGAESTAEESQATASATGSTVDLSNVTLRIGQVGWPEWEEGFKAAGLLETPYKLEFSVFQGGNLELEAIAADQLDFAITSEIPPIFASQATNQGNFKIVGVQKWNTLLQELVIPKDSPIKSVAELKGKKVAYVQNTTSQYFLAKMLESAGLTWKDIVPVKLTTAEGLTALVGGKVDALASYSNSITAAHQNGATTLASAKDILSGNFPINVNVNAINDPAKHAAVADFLQRLTKYYAWTRANQEKWAEITAEKTHQKKEDVLGTLINGDKQRPLALEAISEGAIASQQDIADTLTSLGQLPGKIEVSGVWSHDFDSDIASILAAK